VCPFRNADNQAIRQSIGATTQSILLYITFNFAFSMYVMLCTCIFDIHTFVNSLYHENASLFLFRFKQRYLTENLHYNTHQTIHDCCIHSRIRRMLLTHASITCTRSISHKSLGIRPRNTNRCRWSPGCKCCR